MKLVTIVILNWNGKEFLQKFLPAVIEYSSDPAIEICVADNGSNDNSTEYIKHHFPEVRLIGFEKNYSLLHHIFV